LHSQGYFVFDSKKSGSVTVSHVRLSTRPIASTYLISSANFIACHQFSLLDQIDVLKGAEAGATFLLNSPLAAAEVWPHLPGRVRRTIQEKGLRFYVVDAHRLAKELGLGGRINTIMQACFFALSDVLPAEEAQAALAASVQESYGKRGPVVVGRNLEAIERALHMIEVVDVPTELVAPESHDGQLPSAAPDFVKRVTAMMMSGDGDLLPVSALPVDGTFPTGTSRWEKRAIAQEIPIWDPEICIDCGHCVIVCPHAAVLMNVFEPGALDGAPDGFASKDFHAKDAKGLLLTIQVAPEDCTGCGVCVDVCPAHSKTEVKHKALNMEPILEHVDRERANFDFFGTIPEPPVDLMDPGTVKGSQIRIPLFEFSGACAGCGETPYLKLLTQLFGDRILVANATGCSSIYGGNLPTTPWTVNADGRGPAWANSLFEDNAEFGLGMRLAVDTLGGRARALLEERSAEFGDLGTEILEAVCATDREISTQRERIEELKTRLRGIDGSTSSANELLELADLLAPKSVWIIGGDGWAYDIGSGGLDHVLSSGRDVNVLVLDTEVYSNTGGQASKATPRGAIAKFAARGKSTVKKDLGLIAAAYGDVYVAQVALGANYNQTIKAMKEAEAWPGPSLIIAYSTCIAHGIDMTTSMSHQKDAVKSGYWPLYRFHPGAGEHDRPWQLDSPKPTLALEEFVSVEGRFAMLSRSDPVRAKQLLDLAQMDIDERRRLYEQMASVERRMPEKSKEDSQDD
ncbi:MAG: pyruvate:ferredoxin (flavodoxin) oxidoreductase, partial [Actinomycetota bacterium]